MAEHVILGVMGSSPMLGAEVPKKNLKQSKYFFKL